MRDDVIMPIRDEYEPGRPCWVDLATPDPAAARSFYGELFGWSADVDPRPEAGGYAQFTHDGHAVAGVGPIFAEGMPTSWTTYIATADADATAAAITANGGTVHQLPFDVLDAGRMAVFSGPDGAIAGLWQARQHNGAVAGATQMGDESSADVPPHWQVVFMVDDADGFVERAEQLGASSLRPVDDMAMGGRVGSLSDPQGASFGVLSFATPFE